MDSNKGPTQETPSTSSRRRSSGPAFEGLMQHKRGSSDPMAAARRQSLNEQRPQAGFFGQMWHK
ncbi:hypothetical protein BKA67DRAFT_664271 [Truncatella angustata]|uniref:Conidiation-specific protein 8 n=1 Tax=Truncatella angustata TaxID=152316 RepID=A0A9P8UCY2_9PEZI|nr:uncharacterized protein BKA67DRAFT_664271 [Truncatella angustata]KAH6646432.1 hypothetical protein BKA67DRAFT_664271 [Truncatella angustata]